MRDDERRRGVAEREGSRFVILYNIYIYTHATTHIHIRRIIYTTLCLGASTSYYVQVRGVE